MRPANNRKKNEVTSWLIIKTQTHLIQLQRTIIVKVELNKYKNCKELKQTNR